MDTTRLKLAGYLIVGAGVAIGSGYGWARTVHKPAIVEISSTACGLPTTTASFGVPLQTLLQVGGGVPFGFGPLEVPQGGGPVRLWFDPSADGQARQVRLIGDALYLPTSFGRDRQPPRRISISCREGQIGSVRYQGSGGANATFTVLREADTAMLWAGSAQNVDAAHRP